MVQCAHFAYDDEELSGSLGGAGGCWPLKDEGDDPEEDLFDAEDLVDGFCFPEECDPVGPLANDDWDRTLPWEERKVSPFRSLLPGTTQACQNNLWKID